jgi:type II secretory pathway component PulF
MSEDKALRKEIKQGVLDAKNEGNGAGLAIGEIIVISIGSGLYFSSWWLFGGLLFGLLALLFFKVTKIALLVLFTIAWIIAAWIVGQMFESIGASVVLSIIALLISGGLHLQAFVELKPNR